MPTTYSLWCNAFACGLSTQNAPHTDVWQQLLPWQPHQNLTSLIFSTECILTVHMLPSWRELWEDSFNHLLNFGKQRQLTTDNNTYIFLWLRKLLIFQHNVLHHMNAGSVTYPLPPTLLRELQPELVAVKTIQRFRTIHVHVHIGTFLYDIAPNFVVRLTNSSQDKFSNRNQPEPPSSYNL